LGLGSFGSGTAMVPLLIATNPSPSAY